MSLDAKYVSKGNSVSRVLFKFFYKALQHIKSLVEKQQNCTLLCVNCIIAYFLY